MALPLSNNFETGLADETGITIANSDDGSAGNAFDDIFFGGAGTGVFDTARAAHGTLSARLTPDTAAPVILRWEAASHGSVTTQYGRVYLYRTAAPVTNHHRVIEPFNASGSANGAVLVTSGQKLRVFDANFSTPADSTTNFPLNEWVRIEWKLVCHATTGSIEAKMFQYDSTTALETISLTNTNTLSEVSRCYIGQTTSESIGAGAFWLDDIVVNSTGYPGPVATTKHFALLGVG